MLNYNELLFCSKEPYPEIQVNGQNCTYGGWMLDNMGGSHSEMSAVCLYFYNNLTTEACYRDIAFIFHHISIVEMHHMEIFGKLSLLLGEDPRLWTCKRSSKVYWTPGYNMYPTELKYLVLNSLNGELSAIKKYEDQLCIIDDPHIAANLRRIIMDERIHVSIFREIISHYNL